jgi:hypothetical protein
LVGRQDSTAVHDLEARKEGSSTCRCKRSPM